MPQLTAEQARERFVRARVARLATTDAAGRPHLVPVVFALTGDTLVWAVDHKPKRSTRLRRLANIAANPAVSLLVDAYDEDWDRLWWARADGRARELPGLGGDEAVEVTEAVEAPEATVALEPPAEAAGYVRLLTGKYAVQYADRPPRGPVVAVAVDRWSGWTAATT